MPAETGPQSISPVVAHRPRCLAVVLGSAQDGGVPQSGCYCPNCRAARSSRRHRLAASLALVVPHAGQQLVALVDAGPDLRRQLGLIPPHAATATLARRQPFDAVLLTHLHMGHCAGLLELGPEVLDARDIPVYCTAGVAEVLAGNAPWSLLVRRGNVALKPFVPGERFEVLPGLWAEAFSVPHRDEFGDTVGYMMGPAGGRRILYIPDADSWHGMASPLRQMVDGVDLALIDGTFFDGGELASTSGRDQTEVPHPPVTVTAGLLDGLLDRVIFTHLNHSNPLVRSDSPQSVWLAGLGAKVASEGMRLRL